MRMKLSDNVQNKKISWTFMCKLYSFHQLLLNLSYIYKTRVIKEPGISVSDSAAVWFLQVLASTVTASIPLAPALQKNIIEHTKWVFPHLFY